MEDIRCQVWGLLWHRPRKEHLTRYNQLDNPGDDKLCHLVPKVMKN